LVFPLRYVPNALTLVRLLASPLLVWLVLAARFRQALLLVLIAGLTDWLDGYSARKLNVSGRSGELLDPLADKTMLVALFLVLGWVGLAPVWVVALAMGRDLVIVIGALLLRLFRGYHRFRPSMLGKVSTFFQIVFVLLVLIYAALPLVWVYWLMRLALVLTAVFTAASGLDYVRRGIVMARSFAPIAPIAVSSVDAPNAQE
jgi:cardiolipin synthase